MKEYGNWEPRSVQVSRPIFNAEDDEPHMEMLTMLHRGGGLGSDIENPPNRSVYYERDGIRVSVLGSDFHFPDTRQARRFVDMLDLFFNLGAISQNVKDIVAYLDEEQE